MIKIQMISVHGYTILFRDGPPDGNFPDPNLMMLDWAKIPRDAFIPRYEKSEDDE